MNEPKPALAPPALSPHAQCDPDWQPYFMLTPDGSKFTSGRAVLFLVKNMTLGEIGKVATCLETFAGYLRGKFNGADHQEILKQVYPTLQEPPPELTKLPEPDEEPK